MKAYILLFSLVNGIIGGVINQPNYGNCDVWSPLVKSTGFDIGTDCCNTKGFECQDSKVISIDITVDSCVIDMSKLPSDINLEKYSIKGNIYQGVFPVQLLNSKMFKILDLSNSSIKEIPEDFDNNSSIEEIYLQNNEIQKFPHQFQKINNLRVLNLDDNNITGKISNFCESFKNLETLSLKNNNVIITQSFAKNEKEFCKNKIITGIDINNNTDSNNTSKESGFSDGSEKVGIFFAACIFVIPIALMLFTYKDKNNTSHEEYLYRRNECVSQRHQNSDILPDYNDVIKDTQNLPSYEETINITPITHQY